VRRRNPRAIGTARLNPLRGLHLRPIYRVVSPGPYSRVRRLWMGRLILGSASRLDAFSGYRLGTWLPGFCRWRDSRYTRGAPNPGPLVLRAAPLKRPTPTADRDRPVLRRSEPSSRSPLMGEQTNPWELVHPQDGLSRHRGAEPGRRSGLSGPTSLLSPGYPLSAERWPFHTGPPDH